MGSRRRRPQDTFGTWSENFARYMGTPRFLVQMTLFVAFWFAWNTLAPNDIQFDPYTFTFLTLVLSLQASYSAPLILLAQNRQDDRDRIEAKADRGRAEMSIEINAFLARELADVRKKLGELSQDLNRQRARQEKDDVSLAILKRLEKIEKSIKKLDTAA